MKVTIISVVNDKLAVQRFDSIKLANKAGINLNKSKYCMTPSKHVAKQLSLFIMGERVDYYKFIDNSKVYCFFDEGHYIDWE